MKSCLSLFFVLLVFTVVVGSTGLLYYLSSTSEFSRVDKPSAAGSATPPRPGAAPSAPAPTVPAPAVPR